MRKRLRPRPRTSQPQRPLSKITRFRIGLGRYVPPLRRGSAGENFCAPLPNLKTISIFVVAKKPPNSQLRQQRQPVYHHSHRRRRSRGGPLKRGAQCRGEEEEVIDPNSFRAPTGNSRGGGGGNQAKTIRAPKTNGRNSVRCGRRRRRSVLYCCQRKKFGGNPSREDDWPERQVPSAHWPRVRAARTLPTWHARSEGASR